MSDKFHVVTRKKWIARKSIQNRPRRISDRGYEPDYPEVNVDKFLIRLNKLCDEMTASEYFTQAISTLNECFSALNLNAGSKTLDRLVCFGIGPFTRNFQALHQLAFIICAQRHYNIEDALYFDPIFNASEKTVLERLLCKVMVENCEAKFEADMLTLFYMPHCPNCLTNNLLWCNWNPIQLPNVVLINNSFDSLINSKPERMLRLDSDYILDVVTYAQEFQLDDDYETRNIFNDLSVHIFPAKIMPPENAKFWIQRDAPTYAASEEMVTAEDFAKLSIS